MMSDYWLEEMVESITYKPGWKFDLQRPLQEDAAFLTAHTMVPDAWNHGQMGPFIFSARMPRGLLEHGGPAFAKDWIHQTVVDAEVHEIDEWLRIDGLWVRDPHPNLKGTPRHDQVAARLPRVRDEVTQPPSNVAVAGEQVAPSEKGER